MQLEREKTKAAAQVLRVSMDAKAAVKIGAFSRGGQSRLAVEALDHDFSSGGTITPVGILLPDEDEFSLYGVTSKVTSDCLVDVLELWWQRVKQRFEGITTLLVHLDNGPECQSRRTQFLYRISRFASDTGLTIRLAYYPPYHSKYNPVERCWAVLENHWNGSLLDSVEAVIGFAKSMTWKGKHPAVQLVSKLYQTGVKLSTFEMKQVEKLVHRLEGLERWFVTIPPFFPQKYRGTPFSF